ncbi:MAG: hypothetical protein ACE149_16165, partial [Armatimonadota bacterium]
PPPPPPPFWSPGAVGGTTATNITHPPDFPTPIRIPSGGTVTIGWNTEDNCCRLSGIRWRNSQGASPPDLTFQPTLDEENSACQGGGVAFYNYPQTGDLTLAVTNDYTSAERCRDQLGLSYDGVEYAISPVPLPVDQLYRLLSDGFCRESVLGGDVIPGLHLSHREAPPAVDTAYGASATDAIEGIRAVRDQVSAASLPRFTLDVSRARTDKEVLLDHLDRAADAVSVGLRLYRNGNRPVDGGSLPGDQMPTASRPAVYNPEDAAVWAAKPLAAVAPRPDTAQEWWQLAAQSIQAFIDDSARLPVATLPEEVRSRWILRNERPDGTLSPTASRVLAGLLDLSRRPLMLQGHPLTDVPGIEECEPPAPPPTVAGSAYVPWPSMEGGRLYPGQYTTLVFRGASEGSPPRGPSDSSAPNGGPTIPRGGALIVRGEQQDAEGNVFRWLEQIVAADPPPIHTVTGDSTGTDPVTVRFRAEVSGMSPGGSPWNSWHVAEVVPGDGAPPPIAMTHDSVTVAAGASYVVKLRAEDGHGNLSPSTDIAIAARRP